MLNPNRSTKNCQKLSNRCKTARLLRDLNCPLKSKLQKLSVIIHKSTSSFFIITSRSRRQPKVLNRKHSWLAKNLRKTSRIVSLCFLRSFRLQLKCSCWISLFEALSESFWLNFSIYSTPALCNQQAVCRFWRQRLTLEELKQFCVGIWIEERWFMLLLNCNYLAHFKRSPDRRRMSFECFWSLLSHESGVWNSDSEFRWSFGVFFWFFVMCSFLCNPLTKPLQPFTRRSSRKFVWFQDFWWSALVRSSYSSHKARFTQTARV